VLGSAQTSTGFSHAVLWNGGTMTDLTTTAFWGLSSPSVARVNDSGQIVGTDPVGDTGHSQLFLDSNGTITQLPLPSFAADPRATGCSATAINNNGIVLGGCDDANSDFHAVICQKWHAH
jgi:uncharacterized membrane protein